jgi:hypothetical protein
MSTYSDSGTAGSKTLGISSPSNLYWSCCAVEILGTVSAVSGTVAGTDTNDTASAAGGMVASAPIALTDANDTAAIGALATTPTSVALTDGNDAATLFSRATGSVILTDAADTLAAVGTAIRTAQVAMTDAPDTANIIGSVAYLSGAIALTDNADAAAVGIMSGAFIVITKIAPFFSTDVVTQPGFQLFRESGGSLVADGGHNTVAVQSVTNVVNGYCVGLSDILMTRDSDGGYRGVIVWDSGGGSPFYIMDEVYVGATKSLQVDMTQAVPTSNVSGSVGDALNAARAQGFGKWVKSGTTLTLYAADNTTVVRSFTLDDSNAPTSRS